MKSRILALVGLLVLISVAGLGQSRATLKEDMAGGFDLEATFEKPNSLGPVLIRAPYSAEEVDETGAFTIEISHH